MSVWVNSNECGGRSPALLVGGGQRRLSQHHNASVVQQVPEFTQVNNRGWQQTRHHVQDTDGGGGTEPGKLIDSFLCNCAAWLRSAGSLQLHPAGSCTETAPPFPFFLSLFSSLFFSLCLRTDSSSVRHFNTILHILCTFLFAHTHT